MGFFFFVSREKFYLVFELYDMQIENRTEKQGPNKYVS